MSLPLPIHPSRLQVLYLLRHTSRVRYTKLMRVTGLESDVFKFHLRVLTQSDLIKKNDDGTYSLTTLGKEFSNNLDEASGQRDRSPKLSMIIIARSKKDNEDVYLFHQRHRNPFYGYWGLISGPVPWGKSIESSAKDELLKQTGLSAAFRMHGFARVRDYSVTDHTLLEDKLFAIVVADAEHTMPHDWAGGETKWLSWSEFTSQPSRFAMTVDIIIHVNRGHTYFEIDNEYTPGIY